jgi:hypothetical protein
MSPPTASPVVRLPDPPIEQGPFRAYWRTDGRLVVLDTRRPLGKWALELIDIPPGLKRDLPERVRKAEDRARARVARLAQTTGSG